MEQKPSELLLATFGGSLWVKTPKGERGTRPDWLHWPTVTLAEFHPLPQPRAKIK